MSPGKRQALCPPVLHMWQPRRSPPLGTGHSASPGASIQALARGRRGPAAVTPPALPLPGWPDAPRPPPSPPCDSRSSHSLVVDPAGRNGRHVQIEANGRQSHSGGPVRGRPLIQRGPGGAGAGVQRARRAQGLARGWSGGLPQLPQHQAAVPQTHGSQSPGPGLHLGLCPMGDGHRPGLSEPRAVKLQETRRGRGQSPRPAPQSPPRSLNCVAPVRGSLGPLGPPWGQSGDAGHLGGAGLSSRPSLGPCSFSLEMVGTGQLVGFSF